MEVHDPVQAFLESQMRGAALAVGAVVVTGGLAVGLVAANSGSDGHPQTSQVQFPLPNQSLTPGAVDSTVTLQIVCTQSTTQRRSVPESEKRAVYEEYGLTYPQPTGKYEVDHLISLELGGSNDIKNLWPQLNDHLKGLNVKDDLENKMHKLVCSNQLPLAQAQQEISANWIDAYQKYVGPLPAWPSDVQH